MKKQEYGMVSDEGRQWLQDHRDLRERRIKELMASNKCDRLAAMIEYDGNAPLMTQGEVLRRIGFIPKHRQHPREQRLAWIIEGLAFLRTFLTSTNHLTDEQLLVRLEDILLNEEIRFIPPTNDMSEFIDMNPACIESSVSDRDRTLPRCPRQERGDSSVVVGALASA
jgi:hypothetical protein